jgi:hypothetical protein
LRHRRDAGGDRGTVVRQVEQVIAAVGGLLADLRPDGQLHAQLDPARTRHTGPLVLPVVQRDRGQSPEAGERVGRVSGPAHDEQGAVAAPDDDRH